MSKLLKRRKTTTDEFRELKIGGKLQIDCQDYTAPHGFAKQAGIAVKTHIKKHLVSGYRIEVERIK